MTSTDSARNEFTDEPDDHSEADDRVGAIHRAPTRSSALYRWLDERLGISSAILPVIEHPVPKDVSWWYVLGSATLVAFTFQVITGVALAMTYVPAPNSAYETLQFITHDAILGSLVRGIHYWGASAMIVLIFAHTARVFLFGSFKYPRELNWLSGVGLLFLTLGMGFSGQLLRWDQDAYWAVVVAAEQAGRTPLIGQALAQVVVAGQTVGGPTLTRFYATHVFLLPALMFLLIGTHLYLVVRLGISEPPRAGHPVDPTTYREEYEKDLHEHGIPFFPDAAWKDVVFALAIGIVVVGLAIVVGPPELNKMADPRVIEANPRPDWYFIWYFAFLAVIPPTIEDYFIIGVPLLAFVIMVALPFVAPAGERSPRRRPWAVGVVLISALVVAVMIREGYIAPWSPNYQPGPVPPQLLAQADPAARHGAQLFDQKGCHDCHTLAGTGGNRGPDLTTVGSRLTRDEIVTRIINGGDNMPAFAGNMSTQDLNDLAAFLSNLK